jgi:dihydrofolate reductase
VAKDNKRKFRMFSLIAAVAKNGVVGNQGTLPWHIPDDMAHFKTVTAGKPVVMGRKTWESLPERFRPLPGRRNVVMTRDAGYVAAGAEVVAGVEAVQALLHGADEVMIIGGGEIYKAFLPYASKLYLTHVDVDYEGDAHFPPVDLRAWEVLEERVGEGDIPHRFVTYGRAGA